MGVYKTPIFLTLLLSERSVSRVFRGWQSNKGVYGLTKTVILDGARTPFGKFGGALSSLPASDLGGIAIKAALQKANVAAEHVGEVIIRHRITSRARANSFKASCNKSRNSVDCKNRNN